MGKQLYPNKVREWREYRQMTQEELADLVGCSKATIGHIETGERRLTDKWAYPISKALKVGIGYLYEEDPAKMPTAVLDVWADISDEDKPRALKVLESFRTGTGG